MLENGGMFAAVSLSLWTSTRTYSYLLGHYKSDRMEEPDDATLTSQLQPQDGLATLSKAVKAGGDLRARSLVRRAPTASTLPISRGQKVHFVTRG